MNRENWTVGRRMAPAALLFALVATAVPAVAQPADQATGPVAAEARLGGVQQMYYDLKPSVVYVWSTIEAQVRIRGPLWSEFSDTFEWHGFDPSWPTFVDQDLDAVIAFTGSGWVITPDGYVVTSGHVVQPFHEANEEQLKEELYFLALEEGGVFDYWDNVWRREAIQAGVAPGTIGPLNHAEKVRLARQLLPYSEVVIRKNLDVYTQNWRRYAADVREYSPPIFPFEGRVSTIRDGTLASGRDVAVLKIEGRDLPTAAIGDSERMRIGDPVHLAGFPAVARATWIGQLNPQTEMEASFSRGIVSSVKMDVQGATVLQYDAATSGGHSGGPLFNDRGEVIGMATLGADAGIFFAVPTSVIINFVRAAGVTPSRGMFDRNWSTALDAYYAGMRAERAGRSAEAVPHLNRAVQSFDQALRILPDLPDAVELRREAMVTIDNLGGAVPGPRNWMPWLIGGVIAVGLLLLGWGILARREAREDVVVIEHSKPSVLGSGDGQGLGRLIIQAGPLQGNRFPVPQAGLKIGRDAASCQIVLSEGTVSREHAVLQPSGANSEVMIRNLSGTNPTYVNDRAVQEATLRSGDRIRIGNSVLNYEKE